MVSRKNLILKFFYIFSLLLVLVGLTQISDATSNWQYGVSQDWNKIFIALAIFVFVSILIAIVWEKSKKKINLQKYFNTIIAFYLANSIINYGAAKIFHTQFQPPNYVMDRPIGELSGFWLTWTYFGYSQTMAAILGWTQVLGAILLLFRSTRLIGVFILIPVMVNIDLIDHFYSISPLAYFNALHYTFLLFFLLFIDFEIIKKAIFHYSQSFDINLNNVLLNALRIFIVVFSFYKIYSLKNSFEKKTAFNGTWEVQKYMNNNAEVKYGNPKFWSKIYFEWRYGCRFNVENKSFNDAKDISDKTLKVNFFNETGPADSMNLKFNFVSDSLLILKGDYQKSKIELQLKKLKTAYWKKG
jgi:hypothetical protein